MITITFDFLLLLRVMAAMLLAVLWHEHCHTVVQAILMRRLQWTIAIGHPQWKVIGTLRLGPFVYRLHAGARKLFFFGYYIMPISDPNWQKVLVAAAGPTGSLLLALLHREQAAAYARSMLTQRFLEWNGLTFAGLIAGLSLSLVVITLLPMRYPFGLPVSDGARMLKWARESVAGARATGPGQDQGASR